MRGAEPARDRVRRRDGRRPRQPAAPACATGIVVWLQAPTAVLAARVGNDPGRPLLAGDPAGALARLASRARRTRTPRPPTPPSTPRIATSTPLPTRCSPRSPRRRREPPHPGRARRPQLRRRDRRHLRRARRVRARPPPRRARVAGRGGPARRRARRRRARRRRGGARAVPHRRRRGREDARDRRGPVPRLHAAGGCCAATSWSRSAGESSATPPASRPRCTTAASTSCTCPPRCSRWSTARSAARPG